MTDTGRVTAPRPRDAAATRAAILAAARARFGRDGYERTTLRAVARDVGVDPALVVRYSGGKEALFARAVDFRLDLPDLTGLAPEEVGRALLHRFFEVWEGDGTFLALLRASATHEAAAARMREVLAEQVTPAIAAVVPDHPRERAGLLGSLVLGLVVVRHVLRAPALARMSRAELAAWFAPQLRHVLTGPAPEPLPDPAPDLR